MGLYVRKINRNYKNIKRCIKQQKTRDKAWKKKDTGPAAGPELLYEPELAADSAAGLLEQMNALGRQSLGAGCGVLRGLQGLFWTRARPSAR